MVGVLVIDDLREFNFEATYARSIEAAGRLLADNHYCQVWLDHDMGGSGDVSILVNQIEHMAYEGILLDVNEFVLHTSNIVARNSMYAALSKFYDVKIVDALNYVK